MDGVEAVPPKKPFAEKDLRITYSLVAIITIFLESKGLIF